MLARSYIMTLAACMAAQVCFAAPAVPTVDAVPTTSVVPKKATGLIEAEIEFPTQDAEPQKKLTPLEKRRLKQQAFRLNPNKNIYNPNVEKMPPSLPVPPAGGPLGSSTYTEQGPGPTANGQAENASPSNQVMGACNVVTAHPSNADILWAGFTNGGIWKTTNATNASPTWTAQTDSFGSLSIGAIELDPTDGTNNTLVAGIGRTSSLGSIGGARIGMLRSTDGGANWTQIGTTELAGKNIAGAAARGATVVAAINIADSFTFSNIGIFRSTDTGASFAQVPAANGIPQSVAYCLEADPTNNAILYTGINTFGAAGTSGVYKSTNTGLNWTQVSNATMNALVTASTSRIEVAVGNSNNIFAAIVNSGRLNSVWRSGDGGSNWTQMATPGTTESATFYGIHVGGQGGTHLSIAADPSNANIVYIGGDRQPAGDENSSPSFPNAINAFDYSGRLFRGDASQALASQWVPLTHSNSVAAFPGGGTASSSAPHADSRDMVFDANGRLVEGDDGGVFVRTSPANNTGNWFSLVGNLRATEVHDVAYDAISNKIIVGTQDTGTPQQNSSGNWTSVSTGDGGDVAVDDISLAGSSQSIRYSSFQNLSSLRRRTYDASGTQVGGSVSCSLTGASISPQFYTPIKLNRINPVRLLIGANNGIFESLDRGATAASISSLAVGDGLSGVGLDYGGKSGGVDNPDVVYAVDGNIIAVRTANAGAFTNTTVGSSVFLDVVMDRNDFNIAYAVTSSRVYKTTDTGATWNEVTGDLTSVGSIRCVEFIPTANGGTVAVGTQTGVYVAKSTTPNQWFKLGTNMPAATYIFDLEYDATDNVLVAGALGRSVWLMSNANVNGSVPVTMAAWEVH